MSQCNTQVGYTEGKSAEVEVRVLADVAMQLIDHVIIDGIEIKLKSEFSQMSQCNSLKDMKLLPHSPVEVRVLADVAMQPKVDNTLATQGMLKSEFSQMSQCN